LGGDWEELPLLTPTWGELRFCEEGAAMAGGQDLTIIGPVTPGVVACATLFDGWAAAMTDRKALEALEVGPAHRFADWPNPAVPRASAGVYTIWDGDQFIYVGMAGRGMAGTSEEAPDEPKKAKGLWTRLNSHASGRRSGDQFCVYICDRFVLPALTPEELNQLARDSFDSTNRPAHTLAVGLSTASYLYLMRPMPSRLEREIQAGALVVGKPYLNPI